MGDDKIHCTHISNISNILSIGGGNVLSIIITLNKQNILHFENILNSFNISIFTYNF